MATTIPRENQQMPGLQCYLSGTSTQEIILKFLNESDEIAFVVPAGVCRWKTVSKVSALRPGRHFLWHIPGGPLPLFRGGNERIEPIIDPDSGFWSQSIDQPAFGPTATGVIWLDLRPVLYDQTTGATMIDVSGFSWIGSHYSLIGHPASPATSKWWNRLRRFLQKHAVKVPRGGPGQPHPEDSYAFPNSPATICTRRSKE